MPYRDEFRKKLQQLRDYKTLWEADPDTALKFSNVVTAREISYQLRQFMSSLSHSDELYGGEEKRKAFFNRHPDLFPGKHFPSIHTSKEVAEVKIEEGDFEKMFDALDEEFKDQPGVLDDLFENKCKPDYRAVNHPLTDVVKEIKKDVDKLYEEEEEKKELKDALDFANEELVEKTGPNLIDDAIDANSNKRHIKANKEFNAFVVKNGLDPTKVKNHSTLITVVSPGLSKNLENFEIYKPFLDMGITYDEEYKSKLLQLDELCKKEGLLTNPRGGESGAKEYGLYDYFQKNYALKKSLLDYRKLTDDEQKKAALANIKKQTEEVKTVTAKYERVFDFIEKNFDLESIALSGNIYSGRASEVPDGDLELWRPNLPPKFDFEKSPAVVFLSGFTQLKSSVQAEEVTLQEFMENPIKAHLNGAKKIVQADDRRLYLPRSPENTLGKRMAHMLNFSGKSYSEISGINMMGGRAMEFLYNTSPNGEQTIDNVIKSSIVREYTALYNHDPTRFFGSYFNPNINNMKYLFLAGDEVDNLYEVSPDYVNEECKMDCHVKDYSAAIKARGNTPIEDEYRRIIQTIQDCCEEEDEMDHHPELYLKGSPDNINHFSRGAVLASGRQYFLDFVRENNLSLASIEDDALRQEISDFLADPVQTFHDHHYQLTQEGAEDLETAKREYKRSWRDYGKRNSESFLAKFDQNNRKPHGYNAGKDIATIIHDNRGSWWERWRGTTSKEYALLHNAAVASTDPDSPTYGDKEAMYVCAKAYREHKMPEGRRPFWLSSTAKKRLEFCDSIINAYEQEKAEREAANNPAPVNNNIINNNIINQNDFQNQLQNDLGPKEAKDAKIEVIEGVSAEKDPPEDTATV